VALVIEYHEEIEVDLHPDTDLLDFWRGTLSPRKLQLLIRNLRPDSAFFNAAAPDAARVAAWTPTDYLIADLFDITAKAHFRGPTPYPRPADQIKAEQERAERYAALAEQAERNRRRDRGRNG
jgi:hypothetical protein